MRISAAIQGDLVNYMKAETEAAMRGVIDGVKEVSDGAKSRLRDQVTAAGLGERLAKAWQSKFYQNQIVNPAALVYSKAPMIHASFDEGAEIYATPGKRWLAIPTPECLALFGHRAGGGSGTRGGNRRRAISPANWPGKVNTEGTTDQKRHSKRRAAGYGELRAVWRPRPPHLLVVDNVRVGGSGKLVRLRQLKSGRLQSGTVSVVMFWLVPKVRNKKVLGVDAVVRWSGPEIERAILRHYERAAGDSPDGQE